MTLVSSNIRSKMLQTFNQFQKDTDGASKRASRVITANDCCDLVEHKQEHKEAQIKNEV